MPGPVSVTLTLKWPSTALAVTHTSPVSVNLMALPTRLRRTCVRRCSSPSPTGSDLSTDVVSVSFLFCAKRLGGRAHRLDHALDGVFRHVQGELAGFDLGDVEHRILLAAHATAKTVVSTVTRRRVFHPPRVGSSGRSSRPWACRSRLSAQDAGSIRPAGRRQPRHS